MAFLRVAITWVAAGGLSVDRGRAVVQLSRWESGIERWTCPLRNPAL